MNKKNIYIAVAIIILVGLYFVINNRGSLPKEQATAGQTVELKNGDSYDLVMGYVKKNIHGKDIRMIAYNGSIPGPTIKVAQGSEVKINLINKTDIPTTLHSHGIRMENQYDGVLDMTQAAIEPGESFSYKLKFPDAGIFWYHPHMHEDYAQNLGAYGNFLVVSDDSNYLSPVNQEVPITVGDILLDANGKPQFSLNKTDHVLMGRYGNVLLANGSDSYAMNANSGDVVRYYFTNVANTRPFHITIPNAEMKLVGGDNGKYERETFVDGIMLGPSERAIVDVYFPKPGTYEISNSTPIGESIIGKVIIGDSKSDVSYANKFKILRTNADVIKDIDNYRKYFNKSPDKTITLGVDMAGMGGMHQMPNGSMMLNSGMMMGDISSDGIEWDDTMAMMNAPSTTGTVKWKITDKDTGLINGKINWSFKEGDKVKIEIYNDSKSMHPMQHPIHFHGNRFLILSTNGERNTNMVWKDTVLVPAGDRVDILLDASNIGDWMAHCHISEHLVDGMMFNYKVSK